MIDENKKQRKIDEKARTRARMHQQFDPENYEFIPAEKETDYYDNDICQRVAIYVRVSTDDIRQTTSFELQKKYYEDFVRKHPNWTLYRIYADEGISGTSLAHRDAFNQMIIDAKNGKFDLIITKSVSRFARNVYDFIGMVRQLAKLKPPVGVYFESEAIFSLNEDSQMALSFQATIAEEESHTRSRSMETSLRMRLDNGLPLTPELLGYIKNENGNLIINPKEAPTVKLIFFMYLYGYSTTQIADTLKKQGRRSYLGNTDAWTPATIIQILRNERHCGDVLTRKTYTPDYHDHKAVKNRGKKPQSRYLNHHEGIVSRDDFITVQKLLDNAKFRNKGFLPELRVIESGKLKGFVTINPRWAGFKYEDYFKASQSVYPKLYENDILVAEEINEVQIQVNKGDFDLREFEVARSEFFDSCRQPAVTFANKHIRFSNEITKKYGKENYVELLVNPVEGKLAIRKTTKENRQNVTCSKYASKGWVGREIPIAAVYNTIFELFNWDTNSKYKIIGSLYEEDGEIVYIFDVANSSVYLTPYSVPINSDKNSPVKIFTRKGKRIHAIPEAWTESFGKKYYLHEQTLEELNNQSEKEWQLRLKGQLVETSKTLQVTNFEEIKAYINEELNRY